MASGTDPHKALRELVQSLAQPAGDGPEPDARVVTHVTALQTLLSSSESPEAQQLRLKSLIDKIEHQQRAGRAKQAKADAVVQQIRALEAQLEQLESDIDNSTTLILELQKERTMVCEMIAARAQPGQGVSDDDHIGGEKRKRTGEGHIGSFLPDLMHVPSEQFRQLHHLVQEEQQRRGGYGSFGCLEETDQQPHLFARAGMDVEADL